MVVDVLDHEPAGRDLAGAAVMSLLIQGLAGALAGHGDLGPPQDDVVVHGTSQLDGTLPVNLARRAYPSQKGRNRSRSDHAVAAVVELDQSAVRDRGDDWPNTLLTSRKPDDLKAYCQGIIHQFTS